jgi:hypothetical protein
MLAVVFAIAALAKIRSPRATQRSFVELSIPGISEASRARLLFSIVVVVELGLSALLFARPQTGALLALVPLAMFTFVLYRVVRSGRSVRCSCFGSASSTPVTTTSLWRNALFMGAAFVGAIGATQRPRWTLTGFMSACTAALVLAVCWQLASLRTKAGSFFPQVTSNRESR